MTATKKKTAKDKGEPKKEPEAEGLRSFVIDVGITQREKQAIGRVVRDFLDLAATGRATPSESLDLISALQACGITIPRAADKCGSTAATFGADPVLSPTFMGAAT